MKKSAIYATRNTVQLRHPPSYLYARTWRTTNHGETNPILFQHQSTRATAVPTDVCCRNRIFMGNHGWGGKMARHETNHNFWPVACFDTWKLDHRTVWRHSSVWVVVVIFIITNLVDNGNDFSVMSLSGSHSYDRNLLGTTASACQHERNSF